MIKSTDELKRELNKFSNPSTKIERLVKEGKLFKIKRGLYETDKDVNPFYLSGIIYGPSYISFQTALAYYGLIPERVYSITCATFKKRKSKIFKNIFGDYLYEDVPEEVFPFGVERVLEKGYSYNIATKEKAICDMLYKYPPIYSIKELLDLLFNDLRMDEEKIEELNMDYLEKIALLYKSTNHKLLVKYIRRNKNDK